MLSQQRNDPRSAATPLSDAAPGLEAAREQVDRILASDTLRASEGLRRLLRFLADKTFSGEADQLKEYSIGLDALGKPPSYDPRQDAGVRLQASRLRQKLDEYYHTAGRNDALTIELPKGGFKIVWRPRAGDGILAAAVAPAPVAGAASTSPPVPSVESPLLKKWRILAIALAVTSFVLILVSVWAVSRTLRNPSRNLAAVKSSPELDALWGPFLSSTHRLIIAFSDPVFVRFQRSGAADVLYRTRNTNGWEDAVASPEFGALKRLLGNPPANPSLDFTLRSSLVSTFALSQFLATRRGDVSLATLEELSWQQFADDDVILLAPARKIEERESALPVHAAFVADKSGIRNLHPVAGEPAVYADVQDHQESNGEAVELVSVLPGPLGRTKVISFAGNHAWGVIGGVQSLTDPAFAGVVVRKLKESSGELPPYYQLIIKIKYRGGTPTNASYVTHRTLTLTQSSEEPRSSREPNPVR
jgi:hypothetical protein